MGFNSMDELRHHLKGTETTILDDEAPPETEATKKLKKETRQSKREVAVLLMIDLIRIAGLPAPVREFAFYPGRKFRFDLAWPDLKIAFECEGGIWLQTKTGRGKGHAHPERFTKDCEKYSFAAIEGWLLIRATTQQIKNGQALEWLVMAFEARKQNER